MADTSIRIVIRQRIKPGMLEKFKQMTEEYTLGIKETEPTTLAYEWFMGDDPTEAYLNEFYGDSDAFMAHAEALMKVIGPMLEVWSMEEMIVLGSPDERVKEALGAMGAKFYAPTVGFAR